MNSKTKWYRFLLLGLALLSAGSVVGCVTVSPVESYLADTEAIINEATELALEISNLYETATQLDSSEVVQRCAIYGSEYDDILLRFAELKCPSECYKLREYVIDGITYSKQEVTEYGAYFATGDIEHLYKAESYYSEAQKALVLAAGEWDRLKGR